MTFAVPTGETFSFEEGEDESFSCLVGVNIFAFTETDDGAFVVNRKLVSIAQTITFDPDGGIIDTPAKDYLLGAKYGALPTPVKRGFVFAGWRTEDGVEVTERNTEIVRIYKQVPDDTPPTKARAFSKLKLVSALKAADKWVLVKTWIEERGLWDYYLAAQNFREDNEMFADALAAIKTYARMTDDEAEAILKECIWEED